MPDETEDYSIDYCERIITVVEEDCFSTIPLLSAFFKPKFSIAHDLLQCTAAFSAATAAMWFEDNNLPDAAAMTAKMMLGMSASRIVVNLAFRVTSCMHSEPDICSGQAYKLVLKEDILSTIPLISSCFKPKFTIDQDIMQCGIAIGGAMGVMANGQQDYKSSATMTLKMLSAMTLSRTAVNFTCRGTAACSAMLYNYVRACKTKSQIAASAEAELENLNDTAPVTEGLII